MPTKRSAALAAPPAFIVPSKPKRQPRPPSGERWWHEVKFDGYRIGLRLDRETVTVLSSRGNDISSKAGLAIAIAIKALPMRSAYLDGELVVEAEDGLTDFGLLQAELGARRSDKLQVYLFDVMFLDGEDLKPPPLSERKAILVQLLENLPANSPLRLSQHFEEDDGAAVHEHACELGIEGVFSKLRDSRYVPGDAGGSIWRKAICNQISSFLICGYIPSTDGQIDSVFVGAREGLNVYYRGHVTINEKTARTLKPLLGKAEQPRNPFADKPTRELKNRGVRFVKPSRFVDVSYRGITEAGRLRHPSFVGLRKPENGRGIR